MIEFKLSGEQMRLWIESQRNPRSPLLHIHFLYQFTGKLDLAWFKQCVNFILKNESIFNTVFKVLDGIPKCLLNQNEPYKTEYIDLSKFDCLHNTKDEVAYIEKKSEYPINLLLQPNYRITLYQSRKKNTYYFSCVLPHILIDAYSCDILFCRLADFYNKKNNLNDFYVNNISGKKLFCESDDALSTEYWIEKLSNNRLNLDLGKLFSIDKGIDNYDFNSSCEHIKLELNQYKNIKVLAKKLKTTPFLIFISIYALVLHRYTDQNIFSILYPVNIREAGQRNELGYYVNLLPLQFNFKINTTLTSLIKDITLQRKNNKSYGRYSYSNICKLASPMLETPHSRTKYQF